MMTPLYVSQQPVDDFGLYFSNLKYSASLAATTDTTLAVPDKAQRYKAVIKVENNGLVWVAVNATAAVPAGSTFAATTSELVTDAKSLCREVRSTDVLHFYTATAGTDVSVVFYAVGTNN
jgi:hypothetical protein